MLGWISGAALFGSRALEAFRHGTRAGWRAVLAWGIALALILAVMVGGRTGVTGLLLTPIRHLAELPAAVSAAPVAPLAGAPAAAASPAASVDAAPKANVPWPQKVKEWLNSTVWMRDSSVPWSNDFWSPFDFPGSRPIEAAGLLALLAAGCLVARRRVPPGLILVWAGAVFLGLGYIRMIGYATLASAAVILAGRSGFAPGERWRRWLPVGGWLAVSAWVLFAARTTLVQRWDWFLPEGQHVSRFGQVPAYDDALCAWVRAEFPHEPTLTTIETGSHALLRWEFAKPVYVDGFFAPHQEVVWKEYRAAQETGDLEALHRRTGVTVAILPSSSDAWLVPFFNSRTWCPVAVGAGSVVFLHTSVPLGTHQPQIFCTVEDLRRTSIRYRLEAIQAILTVLEAVSKTRHGFPPQAWLQTNGAKIQSLNDYIGETARELQAAGGSPR